MEKYVAIAFLIFLVIVCGSLAVLYSIEMKKDRKRQKREREKISKPSFDIDDNNITWDIMGSEPKFIISNNSTELRIPAETRMRNLTANILHKFIEFMESTDDVSLDELEQSVYDEIYVFAFPVKETDRMPPTTTDKIQEETRKIKNELHHYEDKPRMDTYELQVFWIIFSKEYYNRRWIPCDRKICKRFYRWVKATMKDFYVMDEDEFTDLLTIKQILSNHNHGLADKQTVLLYKIWEKYSGGFDNWIPASTVDIDNFIDWYEKYIDEV